MAIFNIGNLLFLIVPYSPFQKKETLESEEVSSEDRRFLQIIEEKTTKAGEHYVVPLPFQNESFEMPNNRRQAVKRLIYLRDKFKKNQSYFADYKQFMDDLITKSYARKEDTRPPEKTWFIPHHGMYHQSKPGKIREVLTAVLSLINDH